MVNQSWRQIGSVGIRRLSVLAFNVVIFCSLQAARADAPKVTPNDASSYVGQVVQVCGVVASAKFASGSKGQPTFLNLDEPYPNQIFTAVIFGSDRDRFHPPPEKMQGKRICVTGKIKLYRDKPEIVVSDPDQIRMK